MANEIDTILAELFAICAEHIYQEEYLNKGFSKDSIFISISSDAIMEDSIKMTVLNRVKHLNFENPILFFKRSFAKYRGTYKRELLYITVRGVTCVNR